MSTSRRLVARCMLSIKFGETAMRRQHRRMNDREVPERVALEFREQATKWLLEEYRASEEQRDACAGHDATAWDVVRMPPETCRPSTRAGALRALAATLCLTVASTVSLTSAVARADAGDGQPHSTGAMQSTGDAVRVPAGVDARSPPGADMTESLADDLDVLPTTEPGSGPTAEWVIVPIPFRNPLLGAGITGGVARLYKPVDQPAQARASMYGVGGMYAMNDSWALAAADRRYWADSKVRTTLAGGAGEVRYHVGLNEQSPGPSAPVVQEFRGGVLDVAYHARDHLWVGGGLKFARVKTSIPGLDPSFASQSLFPGEYQMGLFSIKAESDSRSDEFYPTAGTLVRANVNISTAALGSDSNYVKYDVAYNSYTSIDDRSVVAWRIAGQAVTGDPPFFALPWYGSGVDLRGYTPAIYVGKSLLAAQVEWRWQATRNFGLVAFAGSGGVYGKVAAFRQDDWLPAGGPGLRYRVADKYRVNFRVDYAWGKSDETLIVSVGEAF